MKRSPHPYLAVVVWAIVSATLTGCQFSPLRAIDATPSTAVGVKSDLHSVATRADESVGTEETADGLFVGLALSGGGSRSAVFATQLISRLEEAGVMKRVDYISAVSGGAIAGAYYCLSRDPGEAAPGDVVWTPDSARRRAATNFWPRFLFKAFNPLNIARYYFTGYNRSAIMAEVFNEKLYNNKSLAELNPSRPKLIINATRLDTGARFAFTNQQLSQLSIDPARLRIADAVQSSAAFPGIFQARALPEQPDERGNPSKSTYVHLCDAGVFDNLGVSALFRLYNANREKFPHGAVMIIADASMPPTAAAEMARDPDLRVGIDYVVDIRTAGTSFDIVYELTRISGLIFLEDRRESHKLRPIHMHYMAGLLDSERAAATQPDSSRRIIDAEKPLRPIIDVGKAIGMLAPTNLSIDEAKAASTRNAADRVFDRHLAELREAGLISD